MWFFRRKADPIREVAAQQFASFLQTLWEDSEAGFGDLRSKTAELYEKALASRSTGLPLGQMDALVQPARDAAFKYGAWLGVTSAGMRSRTLPDWYPRRLKEAHEAWNDYLDKAYKSMKMVADSLEPPAPLSRQPGQDKLNMFVGGLDLLAIIHNSSKQPSMPGRY